MSELDLILGIIQKGVKIRYTAERAEGPPQQCVRPAKKMLTLMWPPN